MNPIPLPAPSAPLQTPCKCCGAAATLFGVVDFNRNCNLGTLPLLPMIGVPIYYHRCGLCGFIFTIAFDDFVPQDFKTHIYNDGYAAIDPEYAEIRPANNASVIAQLFNSHRSIGILDYGGGNGVLAERLRAAGFTDVVTYDPYVPRFAERPRRRFDLVVSFEVVEHSHRPRETFADIESMLKPEGMMLFSTLIQPPEIARVGLSWWYAAPRNGHLSLFTPAALAAVLGPHGFTIRWSTGNLHFATRQGSGWKVNMVGAGA